MKEFLNKLAGVRGILPLIGIGLVLISLIAQFIPVLGFLAAGDWLLHVGVIVGIGGILVADAL